MPKSRDVPWLFSSSNLFMSLEASIGPFRASYDDIQPDLGSVRPQGSEKVLLTAKVDQMHTKKEK